MNFLFGKKPDIFDEKGEIEHKHQKNMWSEWKKRYTEGQEYNWKKHSGLRYSPETPLKEKSRDS